jgi:hypothetical protein
VSGFTWVPHKPHTLVWGVAAVYSDDAGLYLWSGGNRVQTLRDGRGMSETEFAESFELLGVTTDGAAILYKYWPDVNATGAGYRDPKRYGPFVKRMSLPLK